MCEQGNLLTQKVGQVSRFEISDSSVAFTLHKAFKKGMKPSHPQTALVTYRVLSRWVEVVLKLECMTVEKKQRKNHSTFPPQEVIVIYTYKRKVVKRCFSSCISSNIILNFYYRKHC